MAEVALGKLAAEKGSTQDVKEFGRMMVDDHTKANAELKSLADKKDVTLPAGPKPAHKAVQARLEKLSGPAFDKAYMAAMVKDHRKAVDLFTRNSNGASDDDVQAWATRTLPALRHHLDEARKREQAVRAAK
jgi:putative membrane protein